MSDDFERGLREAFERRPEGERTPPGLRGRVIARAVAQPQRRRASGWAWTFRLAPALAALLVVLIGGMLFFAPRTSEPGVEPTPLPTAALPFGKLPVPLLKPTGGLGGAAEEAAAPYFGPATRTWTGTPPSAPPAAPVERFHAPGQAEADALGARLAASGYRFHAVLDDPSVPLPLFYLDRDPGPATAPPAGSDAARSAADAELARLRLAPDWPAIVTYTALRPPGEPAPFWVVHYQRAVELGAGAQAGLVDGNGDPLGLDVTVDGGGHVFAIHGLVPWASGETGSYELRDGKAGASEAVSAAASQPGSGPVPSVELTSGSLVYALVRSGADAYLEPAYLFRGVFSREGARFEDRVLVPALAASALAG